MNLFTFNSVFLPGLLLAAIPLLLHLFARSRPPAYAFSSNALIARLKREAARIKRPRDWLLLLLRTLLFLALIGVFLQPVLFVLRNPAGRFEPRHVVIIVDATASMAYTDGSQSRFAAACAEASSVLGGLTARDRANVIWLRHPPDAVLPELSGNTAYLRGELRQARVSAGGGDPAAALTLAAAQLSGVTGQREICIISDFQETGWNTLIPALPPDINLLAIRTGNGDGANTAITGLRVEPANPVVGEDVLVLCDVANYSPQPRQRTVYIEAGDIRRSVSLLVPAWGVASASLPCQFLQAGFVPLIASIDEDAFPVDNRRVLALQVAAHVRVGLHDRDPAVADAWRRAIAALGWATVEPVSDEDLQGQQDWDALLLAGWDGTGVEALTRRAAGGTPLTISPLPSLSVARLWQLENLPIPGTTGDVASGAWLPDQPLQPLKVLVHTPSHPLFALFQTEGIDTPVSGRFQRRLRIPPDALPPGETLLAYEDAVPALTRSSHLPVYLWNMPLAPDATDWPKQTVFVLFMGELLNLQRQEMHGHARQPALPGDPLTLTPDRPLAADTLTLTHEQGEVIALAEQFRAGSLSYVAEAAPHPGLYSWRSGDNLLAQDAVNVPAEESDLRAGDVPAFDANSRATLIRSGATLKTLREGHPLWPLLLAICIGLALLEGLAAWWTEWT